MENSYKFFENRDCEYFPCHKGLKDFNCMFCYCPMYREEHCPGNPTYIECGDQKVKDCSQCSFPHVPETYDRVIALLKK